MLASTCRVDHDGGRALRDREAECGAAEEHALDRRTLLKEADVAPEPARDATRDGETDAGAAERTRGRAVDLIEGIEDALGALLRNAASGVGDDELVGGFVRAHHHADDAAFGGELRGVVEQLAHRAPQAIAVAVTGERAAWKLL